MKINVIKNSKLWFTISGILFIVSVAGFFMYGLKLGIDFTGGSLIELQYAPGKEISHEEVVTLLKDTEKSVNERITAQRTSVSANVNAAVPTTTNDIFPVPTNTVSLGEPILTPTTDGVVIRTKTLDQYTHQKIKEALEQKYPGTIEKKFTTIGPTVGESLKQKAYLSVIVMLIGMILFIAWAFRKIPKKVSPWKFGVSAMVALFHDVFIPIGIFVLLGQLMNVEVESFFVTALLTVMGFSVHDTIVVFDRIRENMIYQKRDESFADIAEKSVHQTFARSVNTSLTALITLLFLFLFGSETTRWFVFTMMIGIVVGTYSSIFIASPLLVAWKERGTK